MGWFKKVFKKIKKAVKKVGRSIKKTIKNPTKLPGRIWKQARRTAKQAEKEFMRDPLVAGTKNIFKGITGETAADAQEDAQRLAEEEARIARVQSVNASQFAAADTIEQGGDVVLGTEEVDESLEEQLKRMRSK